MKTLETRNETKSTYAVCIKYEGFNAISAAGSI